MYELTADIGTVRIGGPTASDTSAKGSVHIKVTLGKTSPPAVGANTTRQWERIISTGLDVPLGHTVVLGTAATRMTGTALILTVKPELVRVR